MAARHEVPPGASFAFDIGRASLDEQLRRIDALDDDERGHLHDLARPVRAKRRRATRPDVARASTVRLITAMSDVPAVVLGRRTEVLAWNRLGHLLVAGHAGAHPPRPPAVKLPSKKPRSA